MKLSLKNDDEKEIVERVMTYLGALEGNGKRFKSTWFRRGGVISLAGGVEASDNPDDPAVEGLLSGSSLRTTLFLRIGTPSGQEH
jgi:hypothetical protein